MVFDKGGGGPPVPGGGGGGGRDRLGGGGGSVLAMVNNKKRRQQKNRGVLGFLLLTGGWCSGAALCHDASRCWEKMRMFTVLSSRKKSEGEDVHVSTYIIRSICTYNFATLPYNFATRAYIKFYNFTTIGRKVVSTNST